MNWVSRQTKRLRHMALAGAARSAIMLAELTIPTVRPVPRNSNASSPDSVGREGGRARHRAVTTLAAETGIPYLLSPMAAPADLSKLRIDRSTPPAPVKRALGRNLVIFAAAVLVVALTLDRKSTRLNSSH